GTDTVAHYCLVKAEILLVEGKPAEAVAFASQALVIRRKRTPEYSRGENEASLVLMLAKFQLGVSRLHY
ncbi:MAG: hypothetical protein AAB778_03930, partial [Patescibacteria group bacterium]